MDIQRKAFEEQLILAVELQRPVSIHVVNAWGELFAAFDNVCARMKDKQQLIMGNEEQRRRSTTKKLLPPKIYFHAYSGKVGTLPSIIAACKKGHIDSEDIYFGFAPAIPNFNSAKTPLIMKQIGISQLLLETDLEDATTAMDDLIHGVSKISNALGMEESEVARQTVENAYRFYLS
jgi:Tat protein secretion system quality control protein TatD with DNase activity